MKTNPHFLYFVLLCFLHFSVITVITAVTVTLRMKENIKYNGIFTLQNYVGEYVKQNLIRCTQKCLTTKTCLSLFHKPTIEQCILNSDRIQDLSPTKFLNSSGWKYYEQIEGTVITDTKANCPPSTGFTYDSGTDTCYKLGSAVPYNFEDINDLCSNLGSDLVRVDSRDKQKLVERVLASDTTEIVCIQGSNDNSNGKYEFDDGTEMTYFNWNVAKSQPNGGSEHNIIMRKSYTYLWHDGPKFLLNTECMYICEK